MISDLKKLKYVWRYRSFRVWRYFSASTGVCRKSVCFFPISIGPLSRIKNSTLGAYTYLARNVRITDADLGSYCSIGPECLIGGLGNHPLSHYSTSPTTYSSGNPITKILGCTGDDIHFCESRRTSIGSDVWLGARVIVLDGVHIGTGAIIGANTVVAKDVPPYAIFYGSPPKIHRYRFSADIISRLLETKWWILPPEDINKSNLKDIINASSGDG